MTKNNGNFKLYKEFQHGKHVFNFGDNCLVVYNFIFLLYSSNLIRWEIEKKGEYHIDNSPFFIKLVFIKVMLLFIHKI